MSTNKEHNHSANDQFLEEMLLAGAAQLPPTDQETSRITPWRKSMMLFLIGVALNALVYPAANLNYIFPTIGIILMAVGLRSLRKENRFFFAAWLICLIQTLAIRLPALTINATVWHEALDDSLFPTALTFCNLCLTIALMLNFQNGFNEIQEKAGQEKKTGSLNALVIWYIILCAFDLVPYLAETAEFPLLIIFVFVGSRLWKLTRDLETSGYRVHPTAFRLRLPDWMLTLILIALFALGVAGGYALFKQYPMDWERIDLSSDSERTSTETHLLALGFPEMVLNHLTEEEINACEGALQVIVEQQDNLPMSGTDDAFLLYSIAVELPDAFIQEWKIIHYFEWLNQPDYLGTEAIQIYPTYQSSSCFAPTYDENTTPVISGRVFYEQGADTFVSDYHRLEYAYENHMELGIVAAFSFPEGGEQLRGYITYETEKSIDRDVSAGSTFQYYHQDTWKQYPLYTAINRASFSSSPGRDDHISKTMGGIIFETYEK